MTSRSTYRLDLSSFAVLDSKEDHPLRSLTLDDADLLAELMLSAYRGTIDDEGETLEDALAEIRAFMNGTYGEALQDHSWLLIESGLPASACLVCLWEKTGSPLVAFVMTRGESKGRGFAGRILLRSLSSLKEAGHHEVWAVITDGNQPSEGLFSRAGFIKQLP